MIGTARVRRHSRARPADDSLFTLPVARLNEDRTYTTTLRCSLKQACVPRGGGSGAPVIADTRAQADTLDLFCLPARCLLGRETMPPGASAHDR